MISRTTFDNRGFSILRHPQPDGAVFSGRDDAVAIRREGDAVDCAGMPGEGLGGWLAIERPQSDGTVISAGDDAGAIR